MESGFRVKYETTLLPDVKVGSGRRPVGLQSGFLTPFDPKNPNQPRQQVIVVVTDGWSVLCFNHLLKLMWETTISDVPRGMWHA